MEAINNLVAFKAISNFVRDLSQVFAEKNHNLALYNRLLEKTTISHEKPIAKHVESFAQFCTSNREAILEKDLSKISQNKVSYSDKVFIDIVQIFNDSDVETKEAIWNHLLAISAIVDPASNAKKILRESMERQVALSAGSSSSGANEENFLSGLIEKVEKSIDPEAMQNPMQAVTSILSSGVFTEMVGSMQKGINDGSLDIGKLMGSMQGLMGGLSGGGAGGSGGMPFDLSMITGMLGGMMQPQPPK